MRISYLTIQASIVSLSYTLLIPADIPFASGDRLRGLAQENVPVKEWLVQIDYPRIPVGLDTENNLANNQADSVLELNFTIFHNNIDQLLLNELTIYPTSPELQATLEPLTAPHLIKGNDGKWVFESAAKLGYSLDAFTTVHDSDNENDQQITINVGIFEVAGTRLGTTQTIELQLNSQPSGKLMIKAPEINMLQPSTNTSNAVDICTSLSCRMKAGLAGALAGVKGALKSCHSMLQPQMQYSHEQMSSHSHPDIVQPYPNIESSELHRHSDWLQKFDQEYALFGFIHNTVLPYLVPTLLGVFAGISAGIIGMLFGHIVVFLWSKLHRRELNKYTMISQIENTHLEQNVDGGIQDPVSTENYIAVVNEKIN